MSLVGNVLSRAGLYQPLKRKIRYLTDAQHRLREKEVKEDLERTRREIGSWASAPIEQADPNRLFGIISFTNLPLHAKFQSLVAKAMQLRGYTPIVFTFTGCRFAHQYFRLFGIDRLVMWNEYVEQAGIDPSEVKAAVDSALPSELTPGHIKASTYRGVEIGKHALSMTCRKRVEGRLDLDDPATFKMLYNFMEQGVRSVIAAERFCEQNPLAKLLVRDSGYIPNGGIYETALTQGVDCMVYEQGQRRHTWILKRFTPESKSQHYFSLAPATWDQVQKIPWTQELDSTLESEFAGRYKPDSTDDTRRLQSGKKLKSPNEVRSQLELDPARKTAVIFSHLAWDAAFFSGGCIFDDFEDWLFQTVKFVANECPQMNWIVKVHPFNVFKLQRESVSETSEMRLLSPLMPLPRHVKILPADTDINTQSLFPIVDYVLTVTGTVGMEFPCYGVPAVVAGHGRYDRRGFTIDTTTREEYFSILKSLHTTEHQGEQVRDLARKHFLALMRGRQISLQDIAPMELKRLHEAQSNIHDNITIKPRSLSEFQQSASMKRLGDWMAYSHEADILEALPHLSGVGHSQAT